MPLYNFRCCDCRKTRKDVRHLGIITIGTCVKMEKPCKCGSQRFEKVQSGPVAHTPGRWR